MALFNEHLLSLMAGRTTAAAALRVQDGPPRAGRDGHARPGPHHHRRGDPRAEPGARAGRSARARLPRLRVGADAAEPRPAQPGEHDRLPADPPDRARRGDARLQRDADAAAAGTRSPAARSSTSSRSRRTATPSSTRPSCTSWRCSARSPSRSCSRCRHETPEYTEANRLLSFLQWFVPGHARARARQLDPARVHRRVDHGEREALAGGAGARRRPGGRAIDARHPSAVTCYRRAARRAAARGSEP